MTKKRILSYIFIFVISISGGFSQSKEFTGTLMSMAEFQKQALEQKDQLWVVDFWASWCRPCVASIPEMKELQSFYGEKGVKFVSVSWDRDELRWKSALERFQMPWAQVLIPNVKSTPFLDKEFAHKSIPSLFLIDRNGKVKKARDSSHLVKLIRKGLK